MKILIGIVLILAGLILGLYVGAYLMFFQGIFQILQQIKAPIMDNAIIAWGIVKIVFATIIGVVSALLLIIPGAALIQKTNKPF